MKIAFTFTSNDFYYVALTGTKKNPVFNSKDKIKLPANYSVPQTVAWFETQLDMILNLLSPNGVSYKLTINNVTNNYVSNVYYGQAILNLLCSRKGIVITHMSPSSLVPSKFEQPKGCDLHKYLDGVIGVHPPYWDKTMRDTALISLTQLP
ncbi:MAG: hypothetical protein LBV72_05370 [Tannerella sp.]|jgi:hypothetical protein|nr:hypothetical protein [Tannerella sp.]